MRTCVNCGQNIPGSEFYGLGHQVAQVTGAPNINATVQDAFTELFQGRVETEQRDVICERCFNLLSVAVSMRRTSADALEHFISTSSNPYVKNLDFPLLYNHLTTEVNTKLILQDGVDWYSVIADAPKNNIICYGSTLAIEYINTIQDQINQFFTFCIENGNSEHDSNKDKETCNVPSGEEPGNKNQKVLSESVSDSSKDTKTKPKDTSSSKQTQETGGKKKGHNSELSGNLSVSHKNDLSDEHSRTENGHFISHLTDNDVRSKAKTTEPNCAFIKKGRNNTKKEAEQKVSKSTGETNSSQNEMNGITNRKNLKDVNVSSHTENTENGCVNRTSQKGDNLSQDVTKPHQEYLINKNMETARDNHDSEESSTEEGQISDSEDQAESSLNTVVKGRQLASASSVRKSSTEEGQISDSEDQMESSPSMVVKGRQRASTSTVRKAESVASDAECFLEIHVGEKEREDLLMDAEEGRRIARKRLVSLVGEELSDVSSADFDDEVNTRYEDGEMDEEREYQETAESDYESDASLTSGSKISISLPGNMTVLSKVSEKKDNSVSSRKGSNSVVNKKGDNSVPSRKGSNSVVNIKGDNSVPSKKGSNSVVNIKGDNSVLSKKGDNSVISGKGDNSVINGKGDNTVVCGKGDNFGLTENAIKFQETAESDLDYESDFQEESSNICSKGISDRGSNSVVNGKGDHFENMDSDLGIQDSVESELDYESDTKEDTSVVNDRGGNSSSKGDNSDIDNITEKYVNEDDNRRTEPKTIDTRSEKGTEQLDQLSENVKIQECAIQKDNSSIGVDTTINRNNYIDFNMETSASAKMETSSKEDEGDKSVIDNTSLGDNSNKDRLSKGDNQLELEGEGIGTTIHFAVPVWKSLNQVEPAESTDGDNNSCKSNESPPHNMPGEEAETTNTDSTTESPPHDMPEEEPETTDSNTVKSLGRSKEFNKTGNNQGDLDKSKSSEVQDKVGCHGNQLNSLDHQLEVKSFDDIQTASSESVMAKQDMVHGNGAHLQHLQLTGTLPKASSQSGVDSNPESGTSSVGEKESLQQDAAAFRNGEGMEEGHIAPMEINIDQDSVACEQTYIRTKESINGGYPSSKEINIDHNGEVLEAVQNAPTEIHMDGTIDHSLRTDIVNEDISDPKASICMRNESTPTKISKCDEETGLVKPTLPMVKSISDPGAKISRLNPRKKHNSESMCLISDDEENMETSKTAVEQYRKIISELKLKQTSDGRLSDHSSSEQESSPSSKPVYTQETISVKSAVSDVTAYKIADALGSHHNDGRGRPKLGSTEDKLARICRIMENVKTRNSSHSSKSPQGHKETLKALTPQKGRQDPSKTNESKNERLCKNRQSMIASPDEHSGLLSSVPKRPEGLCSPPSARKSLYNQVYDVSETINLTNTLDKVDQNKISGNTRIDMNSTGNTRIDMNPTENTRIDINPIEIEHDDTDDKAADGNTGDDKTKLDVDMDTTEVKSENDDLSEYQKSILEDVPDAVKAHKKKKPKVTKPKLPAKRRSAWSLKISIAKQPKRSTLSTRSGGLRKPSGNPVRDIDQLLDIKPEISPDVAFDHIQQSFYTKTLKRKDSVSMETHIVDEGSEELSVELVEEFSSGSQSECTYDISNQLTSSNIPVLNNVKPIVVLERIDRLENIHSQSNGGDMSSNQEAICKSRDVVYSTSVCKEENANQSNTINEYVVFINDIVAQPSVSTQSVVGRQTLSVGSTDHALRSMQSVSIRTENRSMVCNSENQERAQDNLDIGPTGAVNENNEHIAEETRLAKVNQQSMEKDKSGLSKKQENNEKVENPKSQQREKDSESQQPENSNERHRAQEKDTRQNKSMSADLSESHNNLNHHSEADGHKKEHHKKTNSRHHKSNENICSDHVRTVETTEENKTKSKCVTPSETNSNPSKSSESHINTKGRNKDDAKSSESHTNTKCNNTSLVKPEKGTSEKKSSSKSIEKSHNKKQTSSKANDEKNKDNQTRNEYHDKELDSIKSTSRQDKGQADNKTNSSRREKSREDNPKSKEGSDKSGKEQKESKSRSSSRDKPGHDRKDNQNSKSKTEKSQKRQEGKKTSNFLVDLFDNDMNSSSPAKSVHDRVKSKTSSSSPVKSVHDRLKSGTSSSSPVKSVHDRLKSGTSSSSPVMSVHDRVKSKTGSSSPVKSSCGHKGHLISKNNVDKSDRNHAKNKIGIQNHTRSGSTKLTAKPKHHDTYDYTKTEARSNNEQNNLKGKKTGTKNKIKDKETSDGQNVDTKSTAENHDTTKSKKIHGDKKEQLAENTLQTTSLDRNLKDSRSRHKDEIEEKIASGQSRENPKDHTSEQKSSEKSGTRSGKPKNDTDEYDDVGLHKTKTKTDVKNNDENTKCRAENVNKQDDNKHSKSGCHGNTKPHDEHLSILTKDILSTLQPVVQLEKLSSDQIRRLTSKNDHVPQNYGTVHTVSKNSETTVVEQREKILSCTSTSCMNEANSDVRNSHSMSSSCMNEANSHVRNSHSMSSSCMNEANSHVQNSHSMTEERKPWKSSDFQSEFEKFQLIVERERELMRDVIASSESDNPDTDTNAGSTTAPVLDKNKNDRIKFGGLSKLKMSSEQQKSGNHGIGNTDSEACKRPINTEILDRTINNEVYKKPLKKKMTTSGHTIDVTNNDSKTKKIKDKIVAVTEIEANGSKLMITEFEHKPGINRSSAASPPRINRSTAASPPRINRSTAASPSPSINRSNAASPPRINRSTAASSLLHSTDPSTFVTEVLGNRPTDGTTSVEHSQIPTCNTEAKESLDTPIKNKQAIPNEVSNGNHETDAINKSPEELINNINNSVLDVKPINEDKATNKEGNDESRNISDYQAEQPEVHESLSNGSSTVCYEHTFSDEDEEDMDIPNLEQEVPILNEELQGYSKFDAPNSMRQSTSTPKLDKDGKVQSDKQSYALTNENVKNWDNDLNNSMDLDSEHSFARPESTKVIKRQSRGVLIGERNIVGRHKIFAKPRGSVSRKLIETCTKQFIDKEASDTSESEDNLSYMERQKKYRILRSRQWVEEHMNGDFCMSAEESGDDKKSRAFGQNLQERQKENLFSHEHNEKTDTLLTDKSRGRKETDFSKIPAITWKVDRKRKSLIRTSDSEDNFETIKRRQPIKQLTNPVYNKASDRNDSEVKHQNTIQNKTTDVPGKPKPNSQAVGKHQNTIKNKNTSTTDAPGKTKPNSQAVEKHQNIIHDSSKSKISKTNDAIGKTQPNSQTAEMRHINRVSDDETGKSKIMSISKGRNLSMGDKTSQKSDQRYPGLTFDLNLSSESSCENDTDNASGTAESNDLGARKSFPKTEYSETQINPTSSVGSLSNISVISKHSANRAQVPGDSEGSTSTSSYLSKSKLQAQSKNVGPSQSYPQHIISSKPQQTQANARPIHKPISDNISELEGMHRQARSIRRSMVAVVRRQNTGIIPKRYYESSEESEATSCDESSYRRGTATTNNEDTSECENSSSDINMANEDPKKDDPRIISNSNGPLKPYGLNTGISNDINETPKRRRGRPRKTDGPVTSKDHGNIFDNIDKMSRNVENKTKMESSKNHLQMPFFSKGIDNKQLPSETCKDNAEGYNSEASSTESRDQSHNNLFTSNTAFVNTNLPTSSIKIEQTLKTETDLSGQQTFSPNKQSILPVKSVANDIDCQTEINTTEEKDHERNINNIASKGEKHTSNESHVGEENVITDVISVQQHSVTNNMADIVTSAANIENSFSVSKAVSSWIDTGSVSECNQTFMSNMPNGFVEQENAKHVPDSQRVNCENTPTARFADAANSRASSTDPLGLNGCLGYQQFDTGISLEYGKMSPIGTYVRKDRHLDKSHSDSIFKRPAPVVVHKVINTEVETRKECETSSTISENAPVENQASLLEKVFGCNTNEKEQHSSPAKRNVMFLNLSSRKARDMAKKKKEEERVVQPKKPNVQFFFPKKRKVSSIAPKVSTKCDSVHTNDCDDTNDQPPEKIPKLDINSSNKEERNSLPIFTSANVQPIMDYSSSLGENLNNTSSYQNSNVSDQVLPINTSVMQEIQFDPDNFYQKQNYQTVINPTTESTVLSQESSSIYQLPGKTIQDRLIGSITPHLSTPPSGVTTATNCSLSVSDIPGSTTCSVLDPLKTGQPVDQSNLLDFNYIFDVDIITSSNMYTNQTGLSDDKTKTLNDINIDPLPISTDIDISPLHIPGGGLGMSPLYTTSLSDLNLTPIHYSSALDVNITPPRVTPESQMDTLNTDYHSNKTADNTITIAHDVEPSSIVTSDESENQLGVDSEIDNERQERRRKLQTLYSLGKGDRNRTNVARPHQSLETNSSYLHSGNKTQHAPVAKPSQYEIQEISIDPNEDRLEPLHSGQTGFLNNYRPWHCALCKEKYNLKKQLIRHINIVHEISQFDPRLKNYICRIDDDGKSTAMDINSEVNTGHNGHVGTSQNVSNVYRGETADFATPHNDVRSSCFEGPNGNAVVQKKPMLATEVTSLRKDEFDECWKCSICSSSFRTKIDVIQHVRLKHKNSTSGESYTFIPASQRSNVNSGIALEKEKYGRRTEPYAQSREKIGLQGTQSTNHDIENSIHLASANRAPKVLIKKKIEVEREKSKVKESSDILLITSKSDSFPQNVFETPIEPEIDLRQSLSVKWYCKLCPNWYRLRKSCHQHVQKDHGIKGNWSRFYFHNSQQVSFHPSMEICTGPHVDRNAHNFCTVCGRSYGDFNEMMRHMKRNHPYIKENVREQCVLDKRIGSTIVVACDIFLDLHVYIIGGGSARIVEKEFFSELFALCTEDKSEGDFKPIDIATAQKIKKLLFEQGLITLDSHERMALADVTHDYDVMTITFQEDYQWDRKGQRKNRLGEVVMDVYDTDEDQMEQSRSKLQDQDSMESESSTASESVKSPIVSLHRCHKCDISFPDRMALDEHNLTHKIKIKFSCRLCFKDFPKLYFLLQHLEVKHNQTNPGYFQFVLEHEQVDESAENEDVSSEQQELLSAISSVETSDSDEQILEGDDVETSETRVCFVCGKTMETRAVLFTHLKEKHGIYKCKCLTCNKNLSCKADLQKHFADCHDTDFVVDLTEQIFRCFVCDLILESRFDLKNHMPIHDKEGYNCNLCDMKYTTASSLRFHKRTVHWNLEGTRTCKICNDKIFTTMKVYESHMIGHFYDYLGPIRCTKCNVQLKNKRLYRLHLESHSSSLVCEHCGKVFPDQPSLRHHLVTHELSENCPICDKRLSKYSLKAHIAKVHGERKKAECPECGKFVNESYLPNHIAEMHHNADKFDRRKRICDYCGKKFKRPGLLKSHLVVHTGDKPYGCEVCGKRFGYKTALNTHYTTHKGFKPHKCSYCNETFWLIRHRLAHMKREHGYVNPEQKYPCNFCEKRFKQLAGLRLHMDEVHPDKVQGPKFYPCHVCKKDFKYRKSLKEHLTVCAPHTQTSNQFGNSNRFGKPSDFHEVREDEELNSQNIIIQKNDNTGVVPNATGTIPIDLAISENQSLVIPDQSEGMAYQTIYIETDDLQNQGQVFVQNPGSQEQIILHSGNQDGELIVALPENCGEYNVDFLTGGGIVHNDGDIGYAEIVVQDQ